MPTNMIFINAHGISEDAKLRTAWIMQTKDSTRTKWLFHLSILCPSMHWYKLIDVEQQTVSPLAEHLIALSRQVLPPSNSFYIVRLKVKGVERRDQVPCLCRTKIEHQLLTP